MKIQIETGRNIDKKSENITEEKLKIKTLKKELLINWVLKNIQETKIL